MAIAVDYTTQTISWFKDRLAEGRLNFKPPYQRNPVWLPKHKAYLIDTVLRDLPVPEVYIQKETTASGETSYALVDGQQRVRTLIEFTQSKFPLLDKYSPGRGGDTWDDLIDTEKKAFWGYRLVVREVSGGTDADLRDLFSRLNQHTITLNSQELRNARFSGVFMQTVTSLADMDYWAESAIVSAAEIRRMLDIEFMAELLVGMMHGPQNKKTGLDAAFQAYEDEFPNRIGLIQRFEATRSGIERMLPRIEDTRWRGRSDFYSLFLATDAFLQNHRLSNASAKKIGTELKRFGEAVTLRLSKEGARKRAQKDIVTYAAAVEKAASDRDRRVSRHKVLLRILERA